jgi:hypothetical protein
MCYEFNMEDETSIVGSTRPIPFAVRGEVREKITQMLDDDIIEPSHSSFINPLTVVVMPGKSVSVSGREEGE